MMSCLGVTGDKAEGQVLCVRQVVSFISACSLPGLENNTGRLSFPGTHKKETDDG